MATVSLNSLLGNVYNVGNTIRLKGMTGQKTLHILIDTGSSHNFLSNEFYKLSSNLVKEMKPLQVTVADGGKVIGSKMIEGFTWAMQGYEFSTDVILFPLSGCDLILGMQWLKTLGPITWDCLKLTMEFVQGAKKIVLTACKEFRNQMPRSEKRQLQLARSQVYCIQVVPWDAGAQCYTLIMEEQGDISSQARSLLEEFPELTEERKELPLARPIVDHSIPLIEGANPMNLRPYCYPAMQNSVIEGLVKEMLDRGVIQPSSSPFASPMVLVQKKDRGWRLCVDYRALNKLTVKNRYPIPLIEDLFDELGGSKVFSKLDLRAGYHQIKLRPEDQYKTAFQTHSSHYEWLVMPFGLSNAPATFQNAMNSIFREQLRRFVLVFFEDILIYSKDSHQHVEHLRQVFEILRKHKYMINMSKCVLGTTKIEYLGHSILLDGVYTDDM